jgi:hypothetical protein
MKTFQHLVLACCLAGLLTPTAGAASPAEREFIWNEANARLASAVKPADFLSAAEAYQRLVDLDVRNGALFYNLGTALLNAERYDDATEALQRAERYTGSRADITRNLQIARARKDKLKTLSPTWDRVVLFWHYGLPCSTRALLAAGAFTLFWIGLTCRLIGWRRAAHAASVLSLIVLVAFASSVATSLHEEANARRPLLTTSGAP